MNIAIIGTGSIGSALARGLKETEHSVVLGARDPSKDSVQDLARDTGASVALPLEAAASADIVILSLP